MKRRTKLLVGGTVILLAIAFLVIGGLKEAVVYFVTPSELQAQGSSAYGKAFRLGGMVAEGSLKWEPKTLQLSFELTDGQAKVLVLHKGTPPDLFGEGRGAVVEGTYTKEGLFRASMIMAKHSEEYKPPSAETKAEYERLLKTLSKP